MRHIVGSDPESAPASLSSGPRLVLAPALSVWLQINPDSDAAELLEVLAREGVLLDPDDVESALGTIRRTVGYWLLPKDAVVLFVVQRKVIGARRIVGTTQMALLLGKEPPSLPYVERIPEGSTRRWGPGTLPVDLPALLALHAETKAALEGAARRDMLPIQEALGRINEAIRKAGIPGWPRQKPGFARLGGTRPLPDRSTTVCGILLRLFRGQLTDVEIRVLEHALENRPEAHLPETPRGVGG